MYYVNPNITNLVRIFPNGDRSGYLRLDMNENPEGLPVDFVNLCKSQITPEFVATYPDREKLLTTLSDYHNLPKENFCISDGSEMAIKYIFEAFTEKGKKVVTVNPTFEMYGVYCNMYGLVHVKVDIYDDFIIDIEKLIKSIDNNTNLVCLLNPNNPIGGSYKIEDIRKILQKAVECNAIVIIDEAYHYFCKNTFINLVAEYNNLIILRTFSKLFSVAACRVGYSVSCNFIAGILNKVRPTFDTNSFGLLFASLLLQNTKLRDYLINIEEKGRDLLISKLKKYEYEYYYGDGNYIFIKPKKNIAYIKEQLMHNKILIKVYKNGILKDYLRITIGSPNVMQTFWNIFSKIDI